MTRMLFMQCKVEMLRIVRNPYYVFWSLLMPIVFYFIFTKIVNTASITHRHGTRII